MGSRIADQIAKLRKEKKMTQQALADAMNVSGAAVCKWESGASIPDIGTLCHLADFFNVSVDHILGRFVQSRKCLVFCHQKSSASAVDAFLREHGLILHLYTDSITDLEACLSMEEDYIPLVISNSKSDITDKAQADLQSLRARYGFKLITINASTEEEFLTVLDFYLKSFR